MYVKKILSVIFILFVISVSRISSSPVFGNGADGDLVISAATTVNNVCLNLTQSVAEGLQVITVSDAGALVSGDNILIVQMTGSNAGTYEDAYITAIEISTGEVTLDRVLENSYAASVGAVTQVIRIPNFSNLTITQSGAMNCQPWNGFTGGIIALKVLHTLTNYGTISASGCGSFGSYGGWGGVAGLGGPGGGGDNINGGFDFGSMGGPGASEPPGNDYAGGWGGHHGYEGTSGELGATSQSVNPLFGAYGQGGSGGNGGRGSGGGGGGAQPRQGGFDILPGVSGFYGGWGGSGGAGGNGGGCVLINALSIEGNGLIAAEGEAGYLGQDGTDGGAGGNGGNGGSYSYSQSGNTYWEWGGSGGGGWGGNGGNGGGGGDGGDGGTILLQCVDLDPAINCSVAGGWRGGGGYGGAGGVGGMPGVPEGSGGWGESGGNGNWGSYGPQGEFGAIGVLESIFLNFAASDTLGAVPFTISFQTSLDIDENVSCSWDLDGDGIADSEDVNPSFTYNEAGLFTVTLTVFNGLDEYIFTRENYIRVLAFAHPYILTTPEGLDFGHVPIGETESASFTLTNLGLADLTVSSIIPQNASFSVELPDGWSFPMTVSFWDTLSIGVSFSPQADQIYAVDLEIVSNDPLNGTDVIALSGTGYVYEDTPPLEPQGVNISVSGYDNLISWEEVTQNIHGDPLTVSYYFVYGALTPNPGPLEQIFIGYSTGCSFLHQGVHLPGSNVQPPNEYFYMVTAVAVFEGRGKFAHPDELIGLSKAQVDRMFAN